VIQYTGAVGALTGCALTATKERKKRVFSPTGYIAYFTRYLT